MHVGALTIELHLPGCRSLKQKRNRLKPLLAALHKHYNISAAEIDKNDHHQLAVIACVLVSNSANHIQQVLDGIPTWIETRRPDLDVIDHQFSLL